MKRRIQIVSRPLLAALLGAGAAGLALLSGCTTPPQPKEPYSSVPWPEDRTASGSVTNTRVAASPARDPKAYRHDAANHLYALNKDRIYKGRLPPMLQAVGVLELDIDRQGQVKKLHWKRAPRHVPQVMAEIERLARAAAPYPIPQNLSQVTYTDVWLWHQSGKFQLDTLTEGQD
jgi:periplasmic protein TonB